jgi:hypothetical protein
MARPCGGEASAQGRVAWLSTFLEALVLSPPWLELIRVVGCCSPAVFLIPSFDQQQPAFLTIFSCIFISNSHNLSDAASFAIVSTLGVHCWKSESLELPG